MRALTMEEMEYVSGGYGEMPQADGGGGGDSSGTITVVAGRVTVTPLGLQIMRAQLTTYCNAYATWRDDQNAEAENYSDASSNWSGTADALSSTAIGLAIIAPETVGGTGVGALVVGVAGGIAGNVADNDALRARRARANANAASSIMRQLGCAGAV